MSEKYKDYLGCLIIIFIALGVLLVVYAFQFLLTIAIVAWQGTLATICIQFFGFLIYKFLDNKINK